MGPGLQELGEVDAAGELAGADAQWLGAGRLQGAGWRQPLVAPAQHVQPLITETAALDESVT